MITYLGRFVPDLSTVLAPLNSLLKSDSAWTWDKPQEKAFALIKRLVTQAPVLAYYDSKRPTIVSADASSFGIGAALYQTVDGEMQPIAYASRSLSEAEKKYAQIEKECLAAVWACERFDRYITGLPSFRLITDHKPLVPLINTQDLNRTPLRCQRLLMRFLRFNAVAEYQPGKQLVVPDTLSRSPLTESESNTSEDVETYIDSVLDTKPMSDRRFDEIRTQTNSDPVLKSILNYVKYGWPSKESAIYPGVKPYFSSRNELSVNDDILFYRDRIIIPEAMRSEILETIHSGHLGLNKCLERAKLSVWWPGVTRDIENCVKDC